MKERTGLSNKRMDKDVRLDSNSIIDSQRTEKLQTVQVDAESSSNDIHNKSISFYFLEKKSLNIYREPYFFVQQSVKMY